MKYYIIAGEASGDIHAANLIKELKGKNVNARFRCWGGDKMKNAGGDLVKHYHGLAFMGFWEVLSNINTILKNIKFCKQDILSYQPDIVIMVDYPGFNLQIARFAKKAGFKVIYYISPQVWAWRPSRVELIKKYVDKMLVILPFEKAFYQKWNYEVDYVGHPLLDVVEGKTKAPGFLSKNNLSEKPIIAVLPGSRKQEIAAGLPIMLNTIQYFSDYQFVIAGAPAVQRSFYEKLTRQYHIGFVHNQTYDLLQHSEAALVTSGTATLEAALFEVPQVVCYKGNPFSFLIGKLLVKGVKYISLVNLIMDKPVVLELIQKDLTAANLKNGLEKLLFDQDTKTQIIEDYIALKVKLGGRGASKKAAEAIINI